MARAALRFLRRGAVVGIDRFQPRQTLLDWLRLEERATGATFTILENVEREAYLNLLANCAVLVGNSSSGILEAPSFRVPVINIGNRQRGRPQAENILNCDYDAGRIAEALRTALGEPAFRQRCASAVNPYGDGRSSRRICETLRDVPIDRRLMDKECTY